MKKLLRLVLAFAALWPVWAFSQSTVVASWHTLSFPSPSTAASSVRSLSHKLAVSGTGAIIGADPIYNPEGTDEMWIMNATEYDGLTGESPQKGEKMHIRRSADGKTIWFRDLIPLSNYDALTDRYAWIKGTVEGNDITVKAGQVMLQTDFKVLYLETVEMDEMGNFKAFHPEMHFTIQGDNIVQTDNKIYAAVYEDAPDIANAGFFVFANQITMQPISDLVEVIPPAGTQLESWVMRHEQGSSPVQVARSGDDVYVKGLSTLAPNDYVKGTLKDGVISIKPFQILLSNNRYFLRLAMAKEGEPDEWGMTTMEVIPSDIQFKVEADQKTYTLVSDWILTLNYDLTMPMDGFKSPHIFAYAGDVPAVPAAPTLQFFSEADLMLQFKVPSEDAEGNYINAEHLSYRFYLDGKLYTFTPEFYQMLTEPMTDIPYAFTDNMDIYTNGDIKTVFLHVGEAPQKIAVESVYTVDGVTNTSMGNLTAVGQVSMSALPVEVSYVDLSGRVVKTPTAGSLVIKTSRYADGSVKVTKKLVK